MSEAETEIFKTSITCKNDDYIYMNLTNDKIHVSRMQRGVLFEDPKRSPAPVIPGWTDFRMQMTDVVTLQDHHGRTWTNTSIQCEIESVKITRRGAALLSAPCHSFIPTWVVERGGTVTIPLRKLEDDPKEVLILFSHRRTFIPFLTLGEATIKLVWIEGRMEVSTGRSGPSEPLPSRMQHFIVLNAIHTTQKTYIQVGYLGELFISVCLFLLASKDIRVFIYSLLANNP